MAYRKDDDDIKNRGSSSSSSARSEPKDSTSTNVTASQRSNGYTYGNISQSAGNAFSSPKFDNGYIKDSTSTNIYADQMNVAKRNQYYRNYFGSSGQGWQQGQGQNNSLTGSSGTPTNATQRYYQKDTNAFGLRGIGGIGSPEYYASIYDPNSNDWYTGDSTSIVDYAARIAAVHGNNREMYDKMWTERFTEGSAYYNPYARITSEPTLMLANLLGGVPEGGFTTEWFEQNASKIAPYLGRSDTTGTPGKPKKHASEEEWIAYYFYQAQKDAAQTDDAEKELAALKEELAYKGGDKDRNLSDEEIIAGIDWDHKYSTLRKMMDGLKSNTVLQFTRGVDFDESYLRGMIWAGRNGGGSGDAFADAVNARLGAGNLYQYDADKAAKFDRNSDQYDPYSQGGTMYDAQLYFGTKDLGDEFLNSHLDYGSSSDSTLSRYYASAVSGNDFTRACNEELGALKTDVDEWLEDYLKYPNSDPPTDEEIDELLDDYFSNSDYSHIRKLNDSLDTSHGARPLENTTGAIVARDENGNIVEESRGLYKRSNLERYIKEKLASRASNVDPHDAADETGKGLGGALDSMYTTLGNFFTGLFGPKEPYVPKDENGNPIEVKPEPSKAHVQSSALPPLQELIDQGIAVQTASATVSDVGGALGARPTPTPFPGATPSPEATSAPAPTPAGPSREDWDKAQKDSYAAQQEALQKRQNMANGTFSLRDVSTPTEKQTYKTTYPEFDEDVATIKDGIENGGMSEQQSYDSMVQSADALANKTYFSDMETIEAVDVLDNIIAKEEDELKATEELINATYPINPETNLPMTEEELVWERINARQITDPAEAQARLDYLDQFGEKNLTDDQKLRVQSHRATKESLEQHKAQRAAMQSDYDAAQENKKNYEAKYELAAEMAKLDGADTGAGIRVTDIFAGIRSVFGELKLPDWNAWSVYDAAERSGENTQEEIAAAARDNIIKDEEAITQIQGLLDMVDQYGLNIPERYRANMEEALRQYQENKKDSEYYLLRTNPDFADMVAVGDNEEMWGKEKLHTGSSIGYALYAFKHKTKDRQLYAQYTLMGQMTPKELDTAQYLLATQGPETADAYYLHLGDSQYGRLNTRFTEEAMMQAAQVSDKNALGGWALGVGLSLLNSAGTFQIVFDRATGRQTNPNAVLFAGQKASAVATEETKKQFVGMFGGEETTFGKAMGMGYDMFTMGAQSYLQAMTGHALGLAPQPGSSFVQKLGSFAPLNMSAGAGVQAYTNAIQNGASVDQATAMAVVAFNANYWTEMIEAEHFAKALGFGAEEAAQGTAKNVFEALVQSIREVGNETVGEGASSFLEQAGENFVMGELSERNKSIDAKTAALMGQNENITEALAREAATRSANYDFWKNVGYEAVMGGGSAALAVTGGYLTGSLHTTTEQFLETYNIQQQYMKLGFPAENAWAIAQNQVASGVNSPIYETQLNAELAENEAQMAAEEAAAEDLRQRTHQFAEDLFSDAAHDELINLKRANAEQRQQGRATVTEDVQQTRPVSEPQPAEAPVAPDTEEVRDEQPAYYQEEIADGKRRIETLESELGVTGEEQAQAELDVAKAERAEAEKQGLKDKAKELKKRVKSLERLLTSYANLAKTEARAKAEAERYAAQSPSDKQARAEQRRKNQTEDNPPVTDLSEYDISDRERNRLTSAQEVNRYKTRSDITYAIDALKSAITDTVDFIKKEISDGGSAETIRDANLISFVEMRNKYVNALALDYLYTNGTLEGFNRREVESRLRSYFDGEITAEEAFSQQTAEPANTPTDLGTDQARSEQRQQNQTDATADTTADTTTNEAPAAAPTANEDLQTESARGEQSDQKRTAQQFSVENAELQEQQNDGMTRLIQGLESLIEVLPDKAQMIADGLKKKIGSSKAASLIRDISQKAAQFGVSPNALRKAVEVAAITDGDVLSMITQGEVTKETLDAFITKTQEMLDNPETAKEIENKIYQAVQEQWKQSPSSLEDLSTELARGEQRRRNRQNAAQQSQNRGATVEPTAPATQPAQGTRRPTRNIATTDQPRSDRTEFSRRMYALERAGMGGATEQVVAITSVLDQNEASSDELTLAQARAAAQNLVERFGRKAVDIVQRLMVKARSQNIDHDTVMQAIQVAALTNGSANQMLAGLDARAISTENFNAFMQAANLDIADQAIRDQMQKRTYDAMVAVEKARLISEGAVKDLQAAAERKRQARRRTRQAQEQHEIKQREVEAAKERIQRASEEYEADVNGDTESALRDAATDLPGAIIAEQQLAQSEENAVAEEAKVNRETKEQQEAISAELTRKAQEEVDRKIKAAQATRDRRSAITTAQGQAVTGNTGRTYVSATQPIQFHYAVVPAGALVTSNTETGEANPDYPSRLQPRDRTRLNSRVTLETMSRTLNPDLLGADNSVQNGAPVVGPDFIVESGNQRTMAIRQAMNQGTSEGYTQWLREHAADFGINPESITDDSILVRVRDTDVDRVTFARQANESITTAMSSSETASVDADKLTADRLSLFQPNDNGDLNTRDNRDALRAYLQEVIPESEQGIYLQADGRFTQDFFKRVQSGLFQRAYGDSTITAAFSESTDETIKNVLNAMMNVAPRVAMISDGIQDGAYYDLNVAQNIADAARLVRDCRREGITVDERLNQASMFDDIDPTTAAIARMFEENKRSGVKMTRALNDILTGIENLGAPNQVRLDGMDMTEAPDKAQFVQSSLNRTNNIEGLESQGAVEGQTSMLGEETATAPATEATAEAQQEPSETGWAELPDGRYYPANLPSIIGVEMPGATSYPSDGTSEVRFGFVEPIVETRSVHDDPQTGLKRTFYMADEVGRREADERLQALTDIAESGRDMDIAINNEFYRIRKSDNPEYKYMVQGTGSNGAETEYYKNIAIFFRNNVYRSFFARGGEEGNYVPPRFYVYNDTVETTTAPVTAETAPTAETTTAPATEETQAYIAPSTQTTQQTTQQTAQPKNSPYAIANNLMSALGIGNYNGTRKMVGRKNGKLRNQPKSVLGYYNTRAKYIAARPNEAGNYFTTMHEIGHAIADRIGMTGTQQMVANLDPAFAAGYKNNPNALPGEAFAEFYRQYMESEAQARAFAGDQFVDDFQRALEDAGIADAVQTAADELRAFISADIHNKVQAITRSRSEKSRTPLSKVAESIIFRVDNTSAAEKVRKKISKQTGETDIPILADIRKIGLLKNFAARRAANMIDNALTDARGNIIGRSLNARLTDAGVKGTEGFDLLNEYMLLLHSLDRDAQGKPVFDITALPEQARRDRIAQIESEHPEIKRGAEAFQQFRTEFLKAWMVDTGLLSQDALDTMNNMYPFYVPTQRVLAGQKVTNGLNKSNFQIKNAKGSTMDIVNPLDTWCEMMNSIVNTVMTNQTALAWHNAFQSYEGLGEFGREITPDSHVVSVDTTELQKKIENILKEPVWDGNLEVDKLQAIINTIGAKQSEWVTENGSRVSNAIVVTLEDGSKAYYQILDTDLFRLLAGINDRGEAVRWLSKTFGRVTKAMSALTTGSNPVFAVRNFLRDYQNSVNYGSWAYSYLDGFPKWLVAAYKVWTNHGDYQQYKALGGGGWNRIETSTDRGVQDLRSRMVEGYGTEGAKSKAKNARKKVWESVTFAKLNEVVEQASRVAEYLYGKNDTSTEEGRINAFLAAQDDSVDFARQGYGDIVPILKQVIPFFGASLQGVYRTGRMFSEAERSRLPARFAKTVINTALASALSAGIILKFGTDDEKEAFENMSDDLKAGHFYLPNFAPHLLGKYPLIRIPLAQDPLTYAVHSVVTNAAWNGTEDQDIIDILATANTILDNLNPFGGSIDLEKRTFRATNPVWQPMNGVQNNRNWYGSKIIPTRLENLPASAQYTSDTADAFIAAGRLLDVSPLNLQYLAEQYTGFVGQMLIPAISKDANTGKIGGLKAAIGTAQRRLTTDPLVSTEVVGAFYDGYNMVDGVVDTVANDQPLNQLRRGLSKAQAKKAYDEAYKLTHKGGKLYDTKKKITDYYNQIDKINGRKDLTDSEKYTLTTEVRRKMISETLRANEIIEDYRQEYMTGEDIALEALYKRLFEGQRISKPKK